MHTRVMSSSTARYAPDLAAGKGRATLSGGVSLGGWVPSTVNGHSVLKATLPQSATASFNQLFVNGQRRTRARTPNIGADARGMVTSVFTWAQPLVPFSGNSCPEVNTLGFIYKCVNLLGKLFLFPGLLLPMRHGLLHRDHLVLPAYMPA